MVDASTFCVCQSGLAFGGCCGPVLDGRARPKTAEALMRSRYAAFATGDADYLARTHVGADTSVEARAALQRDLAQTEWVNLTIVSTKRGRARDSVGEVAFVAAFRSRAEPAAIGQLHERSRFVKEGEQWLYVDGDQLPAFVPDRNATCWCGSGLKAKKCRC